MGVPQEDIQNLIDLGLTFVESKIFLSLIQAGTMKAQTLSHVTKTSRADVYRTLERLQNKGLVEKQITKPTMFSAIPIKDAIRIMIERKTIKYEKMKNNATHLLTKYKNRNNQTSKQFKLPYLQAYIATFES